MRRRSVIRDTIQMTVIQFFLECLALLFNAWMTRRVGAATVGTLALAGSFFNLAAMVAGGHALRQPFCFGGTGKVLRLSGADPAECGAVLSAALGAGVGWHFRFCRAAEPSVPAKHSDGAGSAAYGAPAAAGEHQRLSERIFQCRVPCDSDSRL